MTKSCSGCSTQGLADDFQFCPYCGKSLASPGCPECGFEAPAGMNFCPKCGTNLGGLPDTRPKAKPQPKVVELETVPAEGITIEFGYSSSQSFDFAVEAARSLPNYREYGKGKKAVYRVTLRSDELDSSRELVDYVKGWRSHKVYVDGEKTPSNSVFKFLFCYDSRSGSFKPQYYCFGYEDAHRLNPWGCLQARMPFTEYADWFTWGKWLNKGSDWRFDKERIRHALQTNLYPYRFCPAVQLDLVEDVLKAFPDTVNPKRDKDWKYVQTWDGNTPGLVITTKQYGYAEKKVMIGAAPAGNGALRKLARKVRGLQLPALPG